VALRIKLATRFGACGFSAKSVGILVHPDNASFVVLTSNPPQLDFFLALTN